MKLAIVGYGKMGRLVERLAPEYGAEVVLRLNQKNNGRYESLAPERLGGVDVAIEFTNAQAAPENLERLARCGMNAVSGTTGWRGEWDRVREAVERAGTGMVWAPNFSVGVHVFAELVAQAARLLAQQSEYGAWAWEIHHAAKKDAPSGTLVALVERMKASGYAREISSGSNRAGAHPGTHEIGFDSAADSITLRHTARSREGFARGALRAARWVMGKKGVFEFGSIVHELD